MSVNNIIYDTTLNPYLMRFEKRKKWETIYLQAGVVFNAAMAFQYLVKGDFLTMTWLYLNAVHLSATQQILNAIADGFRKFSALSSFRAQLIHTANTEQRFNFPEFQVETNSVYLNTSNIVFAALQNILRFATPSRTKGQLFGLKKGKARSAYSEIYLKQSFKYENFWSCLSFNVSSINDKRYCVYPPTSLA